MLLFIVASTLFILWYIFDNRKSKITKTIKSNIESPLNASIKDLEMKYEKSLRDLERSKKEISRLDSKNSEMKNELDFYKRVYEKAQ